MRHNRITQSVIIGLAALVATVSWSGLKNVLFESGSWIWPCTGFLILLIFLSLNWLLTKSKAIQLITLSFVLISFFLIFGFKLEYLAVLVIALLFFVFGSYRAIHEKKLRVKIRIYRILKRGLPYILTGLSLIIATVYYFSPLAFQGQNQIQVPRFLFDIVIQPISNTFEEQISISQFSEQFGITLKGNETFQDIIYQAVNQQVNKYTQSYKEYFPLGLAVGIFFAIKVIGVPFMWLVILLSWAVFKILVSLGAIKIQEQAVLQEVIEI